MSIIAVMALRKGLVAKSRSSRRRRRMAAALEDAPRRLSGFEQPCKSPSPSSSDLLPAEMAQLKKFASSIHLAPAGMDC